ncbi:EH signature domain-containing protein [Massilia sp. TWR1-2-2]|uniref:EH signature domain-containing protein n=1 Tax=Massilia sp. TWR1-2-2 TaxID=2804584 RepID=UPI003CEEF204
MLIHSAIESLRQRLKQSASSIDFGEGWFGQPQLVERAAQASEKLFQGYAKAKPSAEDAYAAVLAFARGQQVSELQRHMIASAITVPLRELAHSRLLGLPRFAQLIASYQSQANKGNLWQLTWYGLMGSYFAFDPVGAKAEDLAGWDQLRDLLNQTWPLIDRQAGDALCPDWLSLMREERQLLGPRPADKYGRDWLDGKTEATEKLRVDLDIPPASWFWHELVAGAVRASTAASDEVFISAIPKLLDLIAERPVCRDDALEAILGRYHLSRGAPVHEGLRDYVVQKEVWRNPKLRDAGYATAWNRVPDEVWLMVLGWVNERNLRDFFDILAARNKADEGRLEFWSKYMKQITWTRLIFSRDTMALARQKPEVRALIAREEGAYATLTVNKDVDAFMMRIGRFIIVEFSKKPNACYIYDVDDMKFDRNSRQYTGGTDDLKYGYYDSDAASIRHLPHWQINGAKTLARLGILPDASIKDTLKGPAQDMRRAAPTPLRRDEVATTRVTTTVAGSWPSPGLTQAPAISATAVPSALALTSDDRESVSATWSMAPRGAKFRMAGLQYMVGQFKEARIIDGRKADGSGRVWVANPQRGRDLDHWLESNGFDWSERSSMWFFPE